MRILPLFAALGLSTIGLSISAATVTFTDQAATLLGGADRNLRSGSFADIDNDGDLDLLTQGFAIDRRLFRNDLIGLGTLGFTDVTAAQGPAAPDTTGWSAAWADYDGDGDVDVFLGETNSSGARGDLFRNLLVESGTASFEDVSATTINDPGFHQNVAWADIDNDQDLDLLIAQEGPERHEIYLQGPAGSFTAFGASADFQQTEGVKAYGMGIGDADDDGDLDVYISTCRSNNSIRNNFYENQLIDTGVLTFIDVADTNGTQFITNSYGAEFHDFDDDGDLDLFMVGADQEPSKIWRNDGGGAWTDVDSILGHALLSDNGGDYNGARAIDYDNDGDLDLFFHDHKINNSRDNARALFRNDGAWDFTIVTEVVGLLASNEGGYDSAWGDVDLDGDLDLFFANDGSHPDRLFLSDASTNGNSWLMVDLVGPGWNTTGIGAEVYATVLDGALVGRTLRRDANANAGTFNQSDTPVHFGLGDATMVDLRVVWPGGGETNLSAVSVDQYVTASFITVPAGLTMLGVVE